MSANVPPWVPSSSPGVDPEDDELVCDAAAKIAVHLVQMPTDPVLKEQWRQDLRDILRAVTAARGDKVNRYKGGRS